MADETPKCAGCSKPLRTDLPLRTCETRDCPGNLIERGAVADETAGEVAYREAHAIPAPVADETNHSQDPCHCGRADLEPHVIIDHNRARRVADETNALKRMAESVCPGSGEDDCEKDRGHDGRCGVHEPASAADETNAGGLTDAERESVARASVGEVTELIAAVERIVAERDAARLALVAGIEALHGVEPSYFHERALVVSVDTVRALLSTTDTAALDAVKADACPWAGRPRTIEDCICRQPGDKHYRADMEAGK